MMRFFNLSPVRSLLLPQAVKQLHYFTPTRPEIVIGNNTALFGSLTSCIKHGGDQHPDLKVIYPPFWLDSVHKDYYGLDWGQNIYGLPRVAREIFCNIYPSHNEDDHIKWGQMQELREAVAEMLCTVFNVTIIYGTPTIRQRETGDFDIQVVDVDGDSTNFIADKRTYFYNWYRMLRKHNISDLPERPNTEIYMHPKSSLPHDTDIVVLGAGLSAVWLAKHFASPTRKVICIKRKADALDLSVPSNAEIDKSQIVLVDFEDSQFSFDREDIDKTIAIVDSKNRRYKGIFYSATGFEPASHITYGIPSDQVTELTLSKSKWVSAKNLPPGSLMQSLLQWFEVTENLDWAFETHSYHEAGFPTLLKQSISVDIGKGFFNQLEKVLTSLDHPPSDEVARNILIETYKKTCNPTYEEISIFTLDLDKLLSQRLSLLDEENGNHTDFSYRR